MSSDVSKTWAIAFFSISISDSGVMVIACGEVKVLRDFLCDTPAAEKVHTSATIRRTEFSKFV